MNEVEVFMCRRKSKANSPAKGFRWDSTASGVEKLRPSHYLKRLRRLRGIRCIHKKKFKVTTDSKHKLPIADNLLNRQFNPSRPNQIWVADITYIHTNEGWLFGEATSHSTKLANYASQVAGYLAAIKDLYSCEIVGWAMDKK
jgi:putative transposase